VKRLQRTENRSNGSQVARPPSLGLIREGGTRTEVFHSVPHRTVVEMMEAEGSHPMGVMDPLKQEELFAYALA
jgi:hypothetical protein